MSDADSESDALVDLAGEFADRHRRGERPSPAEYAERHPEMAERIRDLFPALMLMEEFGSVEVGKLADMLVVGNCGRAPKGIEVKGKRDIHVNMLTFL